MVFIKLALLIAGLGYAHFQPLNLLKLADNVANLPSKISTEFVVEEIQHQQDYQTVILRTRLQPDLPEQLIYANWKGTEQVKLGERWHGELQLRPLSSRLNHGGFDRQQWYFSKGITAWANVKSAVKISNVFTWRQQRLNAALRQTQGLAHQGLLLATSFGERAWLKAESWQIYQQTNTAHLIAISGLHIGLAMVFGFILARGLQIMLPTRWITPLFSDFNRIRLCLFLCTTGRFCDSDFSCSYRVDNTVFIANRKGLLQSVAIVFTRDCTFADKRSVDGVVCQFLAVCWGGRLSDFMVSSLSVTTLTMKEKGNIPMGNPIRV